MIKIEKNYNLLFEPWIKVYTQSDETVRYSILDVFKHAHQIKALAGELPTQDFAILRLLLAILHATFGRRKSGYIQLPGENKQPKSADDLLERWKLMWDKGEFYSALIEEYITAYEDRFYLYHPTQPFYQVTDLCDNKRKIMGHSGNPKEKRIAGTVNLNKFNNEINESQNVASVRLFKLRNSDNESNLNNDEIARWLVSFHGYSDSDSVKQVYYNNHGKVTGRIAWLGQIGGIFASADNLFQTLMLNLVLVNGNKPWSVEKPLWEQKEEVPDWDESVIEPDNLSQLLTTLSYRVEIVQNDDGTPELVLAQQGTPLRLFRNKKDDQDVSNFKNKVNVVYMNNEQMTSWYGKDDNIAPVACEESKQMWRDFPSLLKRIEKEKDTYFPSGLVGWINTLEENDYLEEGLIQFNEIGMSYKNRSAIDNVIFDDMSFSKDFLKNNQRSDEWLDEISIELNRIETVVNAYGYLYKDIEIAKGFKYNKKTRRTFDKRIELEKLKLFSELDLPFRTWLANIKPDNSSVKKEIQKLDAMLLNIVKTMANQLVKNAGPEAIIGTIEKEKGKSKGKIYSSAKALNAFNAKIKYRR